MAFKDFMNTVKSEASDAVAVTKLKTKISKEKAQIKANYEKIGEIIYKQYELGGAGEEVDALIAKITEGKNTIKELNAQIEDVKNV